MKAAQTLARGRKSHNWMVVCLVISVLFSIVLTPVAWYLSKTKDNVTIFDPDSGTLLISSIVDPGDSKEILDILSSWSAKCLLDRNPEGLDNDRLLGLLYNTQAADKVRQEFSEKKPEYIAKSMRSHVEIANMSAQEIGRGEIKVRVSGQVINAGVVNNQSVQDVTPVKVDFIMARNPDPTKIKRYNLCVQSYAYVTGEVAKK